MTNEEAKAFLNSLKICINEHPIVADWLVEIADRKTEPSNSEKPNNCDTCRHNKLEWYSEVCDGCSKAHSNYEPKDEPKELNCRNKEYYSSCEYANKCHPTVCFKALDEFKERLKDEPKTYCGDFADRLAYERGVKHAWEVAQKVFDSTVTFYEAEDVARQIDKDINVRSKDEPKTQMKTQNSNLTFKTLEYCDICDHKGCEECIANALDKHCIPSQFKKQIEDECAKEYEELGLKELKELIEADRKTEPLKGSKKLLKGKDEPQTVRSNLEPFRVDEPQTDCPWK